MTTPFEFLKTISEPIPAWLGQFKEGDGFNRQAFFGSRLVYYPGAGFDGQPVMLFGSTHSAHCFVYVDFGVAQERIETELNDAKQGFRGYHTLARIRLSEKDLSPNGWRPHVQPSELRSPEFSKAHITPFGFLEILGRNEELDDSHGPARLAILFLGADGIASYDALFCQGGGIPPPFALVLQDHGCGGNYDRFGRNGLLEKIAQRCGVLPQWLLDAENTEVWDGFERVPGVGATAGGMHGTLRRLYKRISS